MKNLIESYLQELFFKPNRVRKHFNYKYRQLFFDSLSYMSQELDDIVRIKMKLKENDYDAEGLNKKTRIKIVKLIVNETKGKTVIIISHDEEILPYADKTIKI